MIRGVDSHGWFSAWIKQTSKQTEIPHFAGRGKSDECKNLVLISVPEKDKTGILDERVPNNSTTYCNSL